ncbi:MAG: helix-turn-helix transcriptional regulator [Lawsonibacter sp.]|nr:helix-turn-helix transcriptional regulator [Lawsonibacter sp.]MCI8914156.1 helix-turn-helix transcriptional regulator [Lawsonibacter sp.]
MRFAEQLMALRKQRGWSQEELGSRVGVTRQTVSKWEIGQSTPELEKLVELSKLFDLSLDALVGLEREEEYAVPAVQGCGVRSCGAVYEYVSSIKVFGLPLVHIRWGLGPQLAKGVFAIGNCAVGVVAIGGSSLGVVSLGGISVGMLLALGGVGFGLFALGGLAVGGFALGGGAIGQWLAVGGGAYSNYLAIGGLAISQGLAVGGTAHGYIAVGANEAKGVFPYLQRYGYHIEDVWFAVKTEFPHMWNWVRGMIEAVLS